MFKMPDNLRFIRTPMIRENLMLCKLNKGFSVFPRH